MKISDFEPQTFDIERLNQSGWLNGETLTAEFISLYKMYSKLLEQYVDQKVNIREMDNLLKNSPFNLKKVSLEEMDIYQANSSFDYLYLRNTLHIEKLDELEIQQLQKRVSSQNDILDEEMSLLIGKSYQKVITIDKVADGTYINYGPYGARRYYAPNNFIVIGIRYDPEYEKESIDPNYNDEEWDENNDKQIQLVQAVVDTINEENNNHSDLLVRAIEYNEFSVKKKINIEKSESKTM